MAKKEREKKSKSGGKIRVNITVDSELLKRAKTKLHLFGGKLSTLFNAYLSDFVSSMEKQFSEDQKMLADKIRELENRLKKLENK
jgi:uridine kinase